MQKVRWLSWAGAVAVTATLLAGPAAGVTSDRAAAILKYPLIAAGEVVLEPREIPGDVAQQFGLGTLETVVQLSNTSDLPVNLHCFYENANAHCTTTGDICSPLIGMCDGGGVCMPGWNEIDFWIRLTPRQPLAWLATEGLSKFPLDGYEMSGIGGSSNIGSRIPPLPEMPFVGALKCVVVDDAGTPVDHNVVKGEATLVEQGGDLINLNVGKYNAVGIQAIPGSVNGDKELVLGGPAPEYEGCPNVLLLNHFFDWAVSPVSRDTPVATMTVVALVPCEQDLLRQICGETVVQYLVYNEFEQRFSTSRTVECQQTMPLSMIDTTQMDRSIFSAGVAGTLTGQTRLSPLDSGLVGIALEGHGQQVGAFNLHYQGDRKEADLVTLP